MTRALVTGGAGFIGSHITDHLIRSYGDVHVIDSLATGERTYVPKKATLHIEDVRKEKNIASLIKKIRPDVILHIAGQASNINSFTNPHFDVDVNFKGTVNVVMGALEAKTTRFLYASSMTVYGPQETLPVSETQPCRPVSYYGISKYAAERFVHATALRSDLAHPFHATSFRMFNVYGPRQSLTNPYQGALAIFIGNVLRDEPITIFGDGNQTRDFIYIDDVVNAWISSIPKPVSYGEVYNLGNGKQISVLGMVKHVISAVGKNPDTYPIIYKDQRPGEQRHMEADMEKTATKLNIQPTIIFADGLVKTIQWAKSQKK